MALEPLRRRMTGLLGGIGRPPPAGQGVGSILPTHRNAQRAATLLGMKRRDFLRGLLAAPAVASAAWVAAKPEDESEPVEEDWDYTASKVLDLGERITGLQTFEDGLYASTEHSIYKIS